MKKNEMMNDNRFLKSGYKKKTALKNLIALMIMLIISVISMQGGLFALVNGNGEKKETPIASLPGDSYVPYEYDGLKKDSTALGYLQNKIEAAGGYFEKYSSENEYLTAKQAKRASVQQSNLSSSFQPVMQTITVMTTATGSVQNGNYLASNPIPNALVRLDGVPRYTNNKGQIIAPLYREYVELFVERSGYNPHIEIVHADGDDKTIYLKQPNDDIEIYAAMFSLNGELANILASPTYIYPKALGDVYWAEIQFVCNVDVEEVRLYVGDELYQSLYSDMLFAIQFDESLCNKDFYVEVVYGGIVSKRIKTYLKVVEEPEILKEDSSDTFQDNGNSSTSLNPFDDTFAAGFLSGVNIDLGKLLKLNKLLGANKDLNIKVNFNFRTGILSTSVGLEFEDYIAKAKKEVVGETLEDKVKEASRVSADLRKQMEKEESLNDEIKAYEQAKKYFDEQSKEYKDNNKEQEKQLKEIEKALKGKKSDLRLSSEELKDRATKLKPAIANTKTIMDAANTQSEECRRKVKDLISQKNQNRLKMEDFYKNLEDVSGLKGRLKSTFEQKKRGVIFGYDIVMLLELNLYNIGTDQGIVKDFSLSIDGHIGYKWEGIFFAGYVPMYYTVNIQGHLGGKIQFHDNDNGWIDAAFWEYILMKAGVSIEGEVGAGISNVLSIEFFLGASYDLSGYAFADGFWGNWKDNLGTEFKIWLGLRLNVFLFGDIDIISGEFAWTKDPATLEEIHNGKRNAELEKYASEVLNNKTYDNATFRALNEQNSLSDSSYDSSKIKVEKIAEGKYVATWIDLSAEKGGLNTTLKYSVFENNQWSLPKAVLQDGSDFYHDMYFDGDKLHVTWQKVDGANSLSEDILTVSQASEIYYAEFNFSENTFYNIRRITNDTSLDFAPKFAKKESSSDALSIVWQKNSLDDILGFKGTNSIVSKSLVNGSWNSVRTISSEDAYISFVTSAYSDGELNVSYLVNVQVDVETSENKLKVVANGIMTQVGIIASAINNPQFISINGKNKLFVFADGQICRIENNQDIFVFSELKDIANDTYKILDTGDKMFVYYIKSLYGTPQTFISYYDKISKEWQKDICITEDEKGVKEVSVSVMKNGQLLIAYHTNEKNVSSLKYTMYQFAADFEISYAYYDTSASFGEEFSLFVRIDNIGDFAIKELQITAFGQTETFHLAEPIFPRGYAYIEVIRKFAPSKIFEDIVIHCGELTKTYALQTAFAQLNLQGETTYQNGIGYYDITIDNFGNLETDCLLEIYCNGEKIKEYILNVTINQKIYLQFSDENFQYGDVISFKLSVCETTIYADQKMVFNVDNAAKLVTEKTAISNPYYSALLHARKLLG